MKQVELSVLSRDVDTVIEYLGRRGIIHLRYEGDEAPAPGAKAPAQETAKKKTAGTGKKRSRIGENLEKVQAGAVWFGIELPGEPEENTALPGEAEELLAEKISAAVASLIGREQQVDQEMAKVEEALNEARAFSGLRAPFSELDRLSYLTLRIGRLDPRGQAGLRESLGSRAVIIPLGRGKDGEPGGRVLVATSKKGRFALDSELKKCAFTPITIPEGFEGVPQELIDGLETRLQDLEGERQKLNREKEALKDQFGQTIRDLGASWLMASIMEELKEKLVATQNTYLLSGWIPQDRVAPVLDELSALTEGRVAMRSFDPDEVSGIKEGREKVPVSLKHGPFVRGFQGVVLSYGAPPYGTIDPSPLVAFFFTILFGIMFGDLGQGFVLFLLGLLTGKRGLKALKGFRKYSTPLVSVGLSSMVMGCLTGSIFTNEKLLIEPTLALTGLLGHPVERVLVLMPMAEHGGSVTKLFYFFGFTVAVGIILITVGLVVNIINLFLQKKYEGIFFSRTGIPGFFIFWYAIFIALRCILGGRFMWFDFLGLLLPTACMFFGPVFWRLISGERPILEHGFMTFLIEGIVGILETVSTYVSNTVSFLRVGAFALSHAVLSFIVFSFAEQLSHLSFPLGSGASLLLLIIGNLIIIILEGMIVAIQAVRLQYYEFFSKFFVETGVEFSPFRFRKETVDES
jgi:V/A-type H+-transporting ATPase subunit I